MLNVNHIKVLITGSTDQIFVYVDNLVPQPFPSEYREAYVAFRTECPRGMGEQWVKANPLFNGVPVTVLDVRGLK